MLTPNQTQVLANKPPCNLHLSRLDAGYGREYDRLLNDQRPSPQNLLSKFKEAM